MTAGLALFLPPRAVHAQNDIEASRKRLEEIRRERDRLQQQQERLQVGELVADVVHLALEPLLLLLQPVALPPDLLQALAAGFDVVLGVNGGRREKECKSGCHPERSEGPGPEGPEPPATDPSLCSG